MLGTPPEGTSHDAPPQRSTYPLVSRRVARVEEGEFSASLVVDVEVQAATRSNARMPVDDRRPIHRV